MRIRQGADVGVIAILQERNQEKMRVLDEINLLVKEAAYNPAAEMRELHRLARRNGGRGFSDATLRLNERDPEAAFAVAGLPKPNRPVSSARKSPYASPSWMRASYTANRQVPGAGDVRPAFRTLSSVPASPVPAANTAVARAANPPRTGASGMMADADAHTKAFYGYLLNRMNKNRNYMYDPDKEAKAMALANQVANYYQKNGQGQYVLRDANNREMVRGLARQAMTRRA